MNHRSLLLSTAFAASILAAPPLAAEQEQPAEILATVLESDYVCHILAGRMASHLRQQSETGAYKNLEGSMLAEQLTDELQLISKDKHLKVLFNPEALPEDRNPDYAFKQYSDRAAGEQQGFVRAEILEGNVGLIEISEFYAPALAQERLDTVMRELADTSELIFDLRKSRGGHPGMVAHIIGYLFEESVHLNDIEWRVAPDGQKGKVDSFFSKIPGNGLANSAKPVYVLTSERTFSAAEEFAYNLKQLRRATLVGEVTGGGANPGRVVRLTSHFSAFVPTGRAVNPITGTNWEGIGVQPHLETPSEAALESALEIIEARRNARSATLARAPMSSL